jgi:nucleoside triphosphate diphosphatase
MSSLNELCQLVRQLRHEERGSAWHSKQTHSSLAKYTIEESYELADAIESGYLEHFPEEVGDLLFHVLLHCDIGEKRGSFDVDFVLSRLKEKIKSRHPKVFNLSQHGNKKEISWQEMKKTERLHKGSMSNFDDIPINYPALLRADKIQKRAASYGFDWSDLKPVWAKVEEEIAELHEVLDGNEGDMRAEEEFGDVLFTLVNLARHLGIDSESALRKAVRKFEARVRAVEQELLEKGISLEQASEGELESAWKAIKSLV